MYNIMKIAGTSSAWRIKKCIFPVPEVKDIKTTAAGAVLNGIAPDGGLYVPSEIPRFTLSDIST
jgi:hypothetical protein